MSHDERMRQRMDAALASANEEEAKSVVMGIPPSQKSPVTTSLKPGEWAKLTWVERLQLFVGKVYLNEHEKAAALEQAKATMTEEERAALAAKEVEAEERETAARQREAERIALEKQKEEERAQLEKAISLVDVAAVEAAVNQVCTEEWVAMQISEISRRVGEARMNESSLNMRGCDARGMVEDAVALYPTELCKGLSLQCPESHWLWDHFECEFGPMEYGMFKSQSSYSALSDPERLKRWLLGSTGSGYNGGGGVMYRATVLTHVASAPPSDHVAEAVAGLHVNSE